MTSFNLRKNLLFISIVFILAVGISCRGSSKEETPHKEAKFNSYAIFEEPSTKQIKDLQFYFLAAYWGGLGNTYILSIRRDSTNIYGYYKVIDRDIMPPISNTIKTDTLPFIYSTTYFKLKGSDIDTLQKLIQDYRVGDLKDSLIANDLDGKTREVIVFDKDKFINVFRSGSETSIEKSYADFFNTVLKRFTPPEPVPFFRR